MFKYYVYRHIRLDTGLPFYIGIGTKGKNYNTYFTEYRRAFSSYKRNIHWKRIVSKTKYEVEIIYETNDLIHLKNKEKEFISLYGRSIDKGLLTNMTLGGDGTHGFSRTPEINKIIGEKRSGSKNEKSLKCFVFDNNFNFIKDFESFNLAANYFKCKKQNVLQVKDSHLLCKNMYFWTTKDININFIKESKLQKSIKKTKIVGQFSLTGELLNTFNSYKIAQSQMSNKKSEAIKRCLHGRSLTSYGYIWKYITNN